MEKIWKKYGKNRIIMCGFTGVLCSTAINENVLSDMIKTLSHRGPDNQDLWIDIESGIGLAHARLSVIDLSIVGHQPMVSKSGRYVIVFNGEIYNHLSLRTELEKTLSHYEWRGRTDTETLLSGFDTWGVTKTIEKANGMFAFSVWDKKKSTLTLGRDRLGEKPLYYGWQGDAFLFGSELKALKQHPMFQREIDRDALALMMRHSVIPAPHSIYKGIKKLLPGNLLTISQNNKKAAPYVYWDAKKIIFNGVVQPFSYTLDDAVKKLDKLLKDAVLSQMMTDVPLGAFLSGGIDSSTIVALMQEQSTQPIHTFTIGFQEAEYNEAEYAKAIALYLGTNHTELYVTSQQVLDVIPQLPKLFCEPFADASEIPTYLVSQLARQKVTVSLSGDGGDELFAGYNRHVFGQRVWNIISHLPVCARVGIAKLILFVTPDSYNCFLNTVQKILSYKVTHKNLGEKLHKIAGLMLANKQAEFYRLLVSHWTHPSNLVINGYEPKTILTGSDMNKYTDGFIHQMMAMDMLTYLPDDILVKVDRAAMGVSLETRVPMLDHRVVEFAWSLPLEYKLRNGVGKWLLRQVLYKYVPRELIERPKMGFAMPIDSWLRGPLREWAEALLDESRLKQEGFFYSEPIRKKWDEHLSGKRNWQYHLWNVLMFQAWLEYQ